MTSISILKKLVFAFSLIVVVSCDSEYNELGSDIIEDDIHHDNITHQTYDVIAFDRATGSVQANNLPVNSLGVYDNAVFGKTISHFVTQLELAVENPTLYEPVIDSVYLHVPYASTLTGTDATTGTSTYTLNNVYGNADAKMTLSVYRNNYFLRSTDPATALAQQYFSGDKQDIESNLGSLLAQNTDFSFSSVEVQRKYGTDGKIAERLKPGIFMYFSAADFQTALFGNSGSGKLVNNNVFKEYFRGLYFKVQQNGATGAMLTPSFSEGKIVVIYHDVRKDSQGETVEDAQGNPIKDRKVMNINLKGNTINFFDKTYNTGFQTAITPTATDETLGNNRLYLNGGEGAMAVIKLNQAQLEALRPVNNNGQKVLVNEANLTFYVDRTVMGSIENPNATEPLRVYLYDLKNKTTLYDYSLDATTNSSNNQLSKYVFGGILQNTITDADPAGSKSRYKVRITNHINNIINKDSTNVELGLIVTQNINLIGNAAIKTPFTIAPASGTTPVNVNTIPVSSVISPLGTVLYGSSADVPATERLKLEIFYTKPN